MSIFTERPAFWPPSLSIEELWNSALGNRGNRGDLYRLVVKSVTIPHVRSCGRGGEPPGHMRCRKFCIF